MAFSIARLFADGSVAVTVTDSQLWDIQSAAPGDYPADFILTLQSETATYRAGDYRLTPELAARMVTEGLIDAVPAGWTFGYPHGYIGDGYLLCPDCVRAQVAANGGGDSAGCPVDPDQMACELFVYGETPQDGDTCDHCTQYIPGAEPYCGDCGGDGSASELVYSHSGDRVLCRDCIAAALIATRRDTVARPGRDAAYLIAPHNYLIAGSTYSCPPARRPVAA